MRDLGILKARHEKLFQTVRYRNLANSQYLIQDLGFAMGTMRKVMMMLILPHDDYRELYDKAAAEIKDLPMPH